jgi:SLT domain-containing protein
MYAQYGHIVDTSATGYALGTMGAAKGWAMVGERGPELVRFGGGERVVPNSALGSGQTVVVEHHYHGPVVQDRAFLDYMRNLDRNYGRQNGRPAFGG